MAFPPSFPPPPLRAPPEPAASASSLLKLRVWRRGHALLVFCFALTPCTKPCTYCVPFLPFWVDIFFCRRLFVLSFYELTPLIFSIRSERRDDLRGGEDGLRPRRPQGRREEVLLQQPHRRHRRRRSRPRRPALLLAVLQQPAGDEEQVPGPPAGPDTSAAAGVLQGGGQGEFKRRAFRVGGG